VAVLGAALAGCGQSSLTLATDWSSYDFFVVAQRKSRLVVFGVGTSTGKVAALTYLLAPTEPHVVPSTSVVETAAGDTLVVVSSSSPNGASQVFRVDRPHRRAPSLGTIATGDLPVTIGDEIGTIAPSETGGANGRYTTSVLQHYRVGATSLTATAWERLDLGPVAGAPACYVGQSATAAAVLVREDLNGSPGEVLVDDRSLAQDVACNHRRALIVLNRRLKGPIATTDPRQSTTEHRLAVLAAGAPVQIIDVGEDPAHVAFVDDTTAVVDVSDTSNRALQFVDLNTQRVIHQIPLPSASSLTALAVKDGHVLAVDENAVTTLDSAGHVLSRARLPGTSVTFHYVAA
jgi:hypothetical protein